MNDCYVYLSFSHKSFATGRTAIVAVPNIYTFIQTYADAAKEKVCEKLGLDKKEVVVFDCKVLGEDVLFVH